MAYADIYAAATDADGLLRKQITVAIHKAAADVLNEDPATEDHEWRAKWARKVIREDRMPEDEAKKWVWRVLENATILASLPGSVDSDVQFVVNGLIGTMIHAR